MPARSVSCVSVTFAETGVSCSPYFGASNRNIPNATTAATAATPTPIATPDKSFARPARPDSPFGTLTSPEFRIERKYIVFLIGGGDHGNTCMRLLVGGKVVGRCSGANDETLTPNFFDVQKHRGKTARLRIVDENRGGWGHVNVDHIVQSDTKPKAPKRGGMSKEFTVDKYYLIMPIKNGMGGE